MLARIRKSMEEKEEGFTLIELLVVVIIIGILAAIAIPVFLNQRQKGYDAGVKSDVTNAGIAEETFLTDTGSYTTNVNTTGTPNLADNGFKYSSASDYSGSAALITIKLDPASKDKGYCISGTSASTKVWLYDSEKGGLQAAGTACSF